MNCMISFWENMCIIQVANYLEEHTQDGNKWQSVGYENTVISAFFIHLCFLIFYNEHMLLFY